MVRDPSWVLLRPEISVLVSEMKFVTERAANCRLLSDRMRVASSSLKSVVDRPAIWVLVSARTWVVDRRFTAVALIAGLIYVFIWEGLVNGLFAGTRLLSVRHYTLGVADWFVDLPPSGFDAALDPATALILMLVVGAVTTWYAAEKTVVSVGP